MRPTSRLDYSSIYTVEHNVKVKDFGEVDSKSRSDPESELKLRA